MTEEEIKELRAKHEEALRKHNFIVKGEFITPAVYKNFFKDHGYILAGYNDNPNWDSKYTNFFEFEEDYKPSLNRAFILVGKPEEWGKHINNYYCNNIVNNPFVKYVHISLTEFKIYTIAKNKDAEGWGSDECLYMGKLEKDLSKEWLKCLVKLCPEFAEYQLKRCEEKKVEARKNSEYKQGLIAKRLAELSEELKSVSTVMNDEIAENNEMIKTIKAAQEEINTTI